MSGTARHSTVQHDMVRLKAHSSCKYSIKYLQRPVAHAVACHKHLHPVTIQRTKQSINSAVTHLFGGPIKPHTCPHLCCCVPLHAHDGVPVEGKEVQAALAGSSTRATTGGQLAPVPHLERAVSST
jgi:hypothetical protein